MNLPAPDGLGQTLSTARQNSFFTWFHLEPDPALPEKAGAGWRWFQPSGESFHNLVQLALRVDEADNIETAILGVDRAFIEPPSLRPFARDIVRSFLIWGLPEKARAPFQARIDEIGQFADGESRVIQSVSAPDGSRRDPTDASTGSDWANAFLGRADRAESRAGGFHATLANLNEPLPADVASRGANAPPPPFVPDAPRWLRVEISALAP